MELMQANKQWASRPAEERFTSLVEMHAAAEARRAISRASVVSSRALRVATTGATAYARSIPHQADRVEFETEAGRLLELVEA